MKKPKQMGFEILDHTNAKYFGGAYLKNSNPKTKRPITTKKSMHLVLRSLMAKGAFSFLKFDKKITALVNRQAKRFGVRIYHIANGGNHLHMIILPHSRQSFNGFIRAISGIIPRVVLGVERGRAKNLKFWDKRPFTRIIEWGRAYKSLCIYLMQNTLEALGFLPYEARRNRYNSTA